MLVYPIENITGQHLYKNGVVVKFVVGIKYNPDRIQNVQFVMYFYVATKKIVWLFTIKSLIKIYRKLKSKIFLDLSYLTILLSTKNVFFFK